MDCDGTGAPDHAFAVRVPGGGCTPPGPCGEPAATTDGGRTWTVVATAGYAVMGMDFGDPRTGVITGSKVCAGTGDFADAHDGWLLTQGGALDATADGGTSWSPR